MPFIIEWDEKKVSQRIILKNSLLKYNKIKTLALTPNKMNQNPETH